MEETIVLQANSGYFEKPTKLYNGELVLTNKRILFSGEHERVKYDYGIGNQVVKKMEDVLGYNKGIEHLIEIPVQEVTAELKRFGFTKRLILKDSQGKVYKLQLHDRKLQPSWIQTIDELKIKK